MGVEDAEIWETGPSFDRSERLQGLEDLFPQGRLKNIKRRQNRILEQDAQKKGYDCCLDILSTANWTRGLLTSSFWSWWRDGEQDGGGVAWAI